MLLEVVTRIRNSQTNQITGGSNAIISRLVSSGPTSYANLVTGESSRKFVNFCTLLAPAGNEDDVVISLESIRNISECYANTVYGFFLGKRLAYSVIEVKFHGVPMTAFNEDGLSVIATKLGTPVMLDSYTFDMCMQSWGRSSYTRAMIELQADVELKDTLVCPKNIVLDVVKNMKNHIQAIRGVQVGLKVGFKQTKQVYRLVSNKNSASTSGKKKQAGLSRQEVNDSNPFDALNTVESNDDLGTNRGISKAYGKGSLNVAPGSSSTTPIVEKINKI
ncbi:hypothetical protein Tco_0327830 [Tanacetum coccineum]